MPFRLRVQGPRACFPRPEFRRDQISYDVIPPFHARAIFNSIYWRSAMRWHIDAIQVLNPIRFIEERTPNRRLVLADPHYLIDGHFSVEPNANAAQFTKMFLRSARRKQYATTPFLGLPEYPVQIELIEEEDQLSAPTNMHTGSCDLGWLPLDLEEGSRPHMQYFRAAMEDGRISVPPLGSSALAS
nr:CRISPR-associated protein Cas5 [uncultured Sphingomonas sp.]